MVKLKDNLFIVIATLFLAIVVWFIWSSIITEKNIPSGAKKVFSQQSSFKVSCDGNG